MNKITFFLILTIAQTGAQSKIDFNQFYPVDRGHSFIEFSIPYMGYAKMKGRFSDFSGMVCYDAANPERTSVTLGIKTESIDTDHDFRDNDLKSDNWFDAKQFPMITFTSKKFTKTNTGFEMTGLLTIKNVTKEVVLKMDAPSGVLKDIRQDDQLIFTGTTKLNRTDFSVEGKNWSAIKEGITAVGNDVTIDFSILCKQTKLPNWSNRLRNMDSPAGKIGKALKEGGVPQAIEVFKKIKAEGTVDRNALSTVGYLLVLEGNFKDAIKIYEVNQEAFPDSPEVYYDLGEATGFAGDLPRAKAYYQEALKRNPNYYWAIEVLRHF